MTIDQLIEALKPGDHFIGMWVVKIKRKEKYYVRWCVSYIDLNNVHAETDLYSDPREALLDCGREIGAQVW